MIGMPAFNISPAKQLFNAAVEKQTAGDTVEAERLYREVIAIDPKDCLANFNLGVASLGRGDLAAAAKLFLTAWDNTPNHVESAVNLIYALQTQEKLDDIKALFPKFVGVANKLYGDGETDNALRIADLLISIDNERQVPDAYWVRANCMMSLNRAGEALQQFAAITQTWPQYGLSCLCNISMVHWQLLGDGDQAAQGARRLLASATPGSSFELVALETLLKALPFHAATMLFDLNEIGDRHRKMVAAKRKPTAMGPITNPDGKLRVGFLIDKSIGSGASRGLWDLIRHLPDAGVEPAIHDVTAAPASGGVYGLSAEEAAATLRKLGYDVLIDATDPTITPPPGLLDYRAAPIQLAYPHRVFPTASGQIDGAFATRQMLTVDGADQAQRWLPLSGPFLGGEPSPLAPALGPCPSERNGFVTFGVIAPAGAAGYSALDSYASILSAVPSSKLLFVNELATSADYQLRVTTRLARDGVEKDRVSFRAAVAHGDILAALNDIDIVLDSFPTPSFLTADAAWQGVFSIGFSGGAHPVARRAIATYEALEMSDLMAPNRDDMQSIAIDLAQDAQRRRDFRANARAAYADAPLFDSAAFARDFVAALRNGCRAK